MLATAAIMAAVITVNAQPPHEGQQRQSPEERQQAMVERMAEKLGLTEQQQKLIIELHKEMTPERGERPPRPEGPKAEKPDRSSREEMEKRREEIKAEMEARMADFEAKMKNILTPEQFEQWKEDRGKMQERRPEARRNDRRGPHGEPRKAAPHEKKDNEEYKG